MSIKVLTPEVAAKIAAGEVVERPASVVKELVENSLDAGASEITVEVAGGGIQLIRVSDNGCGIPTPEVDLAFQRHATSKMSQASDLDSIDTLGFRGEALPSIASVARVSLFTATRDGSPGYELSLRGGRVTKSGSKGCPPGTSVAVHGLFEDLPARRKFLKSPSAETGRIGDLVSRHAIAFPEIRFRLLVDGRNTLTTPGTGRLADALVSVYGADVASSLVEVAWDGPGDGYGVHGYISSPSLTRANRSYITFLVNRRWVQSAVLSMALSESYQGFLPERRHPLAVLNLNVPAADVDVNVHPAKREVRFRQESRVFSALQRAVRATVVAASPLPEMRLEGEPAGVRFQWTGIGVPPALPSQQQWQRDFPMTRTPPGPAPTAAQAMPSLRILGQVRNTYVVAEGPKGLYLIDQHAGHERVLFEKVSKGVGERTLQAQALLEPVAVELSPGQEELVRSSMELLESHAFVLEPFGDRTYLLRALPAVCGSLDPAKALPEILDLMAYEEVLKGREQALAASIACHSSVRAGMALSQQEMEELVRQLESCDNLYTCPHGRPTMVHLSSSHLESEFGRR